LARGQLGVLGVKFLFLAGNLLALLLAVWGIYCVRQRWAELLHLLSFPLFLLVAQIPMWTESRYTLPIMPIMAIFSAVGLQRIMEGRPLARLYEFSTRRKKSIERQ
jgi:hypothetical protein